MHELRTLLFTAAIFAGCFVNAQSSKSGKKFKVAEQKNIAYVKKEQMHYHDEKHRLDIFYPALGENCTMLVFVHGGTWMSGSKDLYSDLGRHFASKGISTAIINYRLGGNNTYHEMAMDCAAAIKWANENAKKYNADPAKIVVCGHSAGAHLSALVTLDESYFRELKIPNPVKAGILIDAFGLNIDTFIRSPFAQAYMQYIAKVFTNDETSWRKASPVSHIETNRIPFYVLTGSLTYPFVKEDNRMFVQKMKAIKADVKAEEIAGKNHHQMITQLKQVNDPLYSRMINFIREKVR